MYIPLDHLYHWLHSLADRPVNIYYCYPHGSKNLENFVMYPKFDNLATKHHFNVVCFDQEPLNFDRYQNIDQDQYLLNCGANPAAYDWPLFNRTLTNLNIMVNKFHTSVYDSTVLVHSEYNSSDVDKYMAAGYKTAHYWCHAVIARDWYRFANNDQRLKYSSMPDNDFLIYSRDWSGSREYRLKFLELICQNNLQQHSKYFFNQHSADTGCHFSKYNFVNPAFKVQNLTIDSSILPSSVDSTASADYDVNDFLSTKISVILETQFDDTKIHLTEKICRALACGHPFLLAAGPGSLTYLKRYGFKTFSPWLDENYDNEIDSVARLEKIVHAMNIFANSSYQNKQKIWHQCCLIAAYNQRRFFSQSFADQLANELQLNLDQALAQASVTKGKNFLYERKLVKQVLGHHKAKYPGLKQHLQLLRRLRRLC